MPHYRDWFAASASKAKTYVDENVDGYMKLGDIRGEFSPSREADGVSDQVAQFTTGGGGDSLTDAGLGNNSFNQFAGIWTNGGASTFKADALTNYRPESFSEVEMHFATPPVDAPSKFELDKSSTKYNPGKGASFATEQAEGWIIIESMVNQDNVQGLDAGGMNYAEAVGLDSSPLELINKIGGSAIPGGDDI